jgi:hypothetical protein
MHDKNASPVICLGCGELIVLIDGEWKRVGREDKIATCRGSEYIDNRHVPNFPAPQPSVAAAEQRGIRKALDAVSCALDDLRSSALNGAYLSAILDAQQAITRLLSQDAAPPVPEGDSNVTR